MKDRRYVDCMKRQSRTTEQDRAAASPRPATGQSPSTARATSIDSNTPSSEPSLEQRVVVSWVKWVLIWSGIISREAATENIEHEIARVIIEPVQNSLKIPQIKSPNNEIWQSSFSESALEFIKLLEREDKFPLKYRLMSETDYESHLRSNLIALGASDHEARKIAHAIVPSFYESVREGKRLGIRESAYLLATVALATVHSLDQAHTEVTTGLSKLWINRGEAFGTAENFLKFYYGDRLGMQGDLDQPTLRKLDPQLMDALNLEFRGERRAELRALVPTKSERIDQRLKAELGYIPTGAARRSAVTVLGRGHRPGLRKR